MREKEGVGGAEGTGKRCRGQDGQGINGGWVGSVRR